MMSRIRGWIEDARVILRALRPVPQPPVTTRAQTPENVLPEDPWTWREPVSERELLALRREALVVLKDRGTKFERLSCDGCVRRRVCCLAYDALNTDYYCLYDK